MIRRTASGKAKNGTTCSQAWRQLWASHQLHPALLQSEIAAQFLDRAMIGLRQPPDPAGQQLIAYRRRATRQGLGRHPNSATGWRGMLQACFAHNRLDVF